MPASIKVQMHLSVNFSKEGDVWVAESPDLDMASQGADRDDAARNLVEAIQLMLETALEMGTLEQMLREAGLRPLHEVAPGASDQRHDDDDGGVDIEIPMAFGKANEPANHAH